MITWGFRPLTEAEVDSRASSGTWQQARKGAEVRGQETFGHVHQRVKLSLPAF